MQYNQISNRSQPISTISATGKPSKIATCDDFAANIKTPGNNGWNRCLSGLIALKDEGQIQG